MTNRGTMNRSGIILALVLFFSAGSVFADGPLYCNYAFQGAAFVGCNAASAAAAAELAAIGATGTSADPCVQGTGSNDHTYSCTYTTYDIYHVQCKSQTTQCSNHTWPVGTECLAQADVTLYTPNQEPIPFCDDGCQMEATTGSCGDDGCILNATPTGNACAPADVPEPDLPDNCIRNESTGNVACDCSVTPDAAYCLDPEIDDHDLPPNCIRNESTGVIMCAGDITPPVDPNDPVPPDNPDPSDDPIRGDDDGDGICEVGEACEGDDVANDLLKDILDAITGVGVDAGSDPSIFETAAKAEVAEFAGKQKMGLNDPMADELLEGIDGAGNTFADQLSAAFLSGAACPVIGGTLPGGETFSMDTAEVGQALRGIGTLVLWGTVLIFAWTALFRGFGGD